MRTVAVLAACAIGLQAAPAQPPQPTPTAPAQQAQAATSTRVYTSDAGMVLNFIRPDKTADFEELIDKLKEAMAKSTKPERQEQAKSWRIYKSPDPAAGGSVLYVFFNDPAVKGADYAVTTILGEAFPPEEVTELTKKFIESYAPGQNFVNLSLVSDLAK